MNKKLSVTFLILVTILVCIDGRKTTSRSRGSGRGVGRKTYQSPQPVPPTSFSQPQPSAPKPSLFGWQEKPVQRTQTSSRQSKPSNSQGHSYPSSNTGLSGNANQPKQPSTYQESIQRSNTAQHSPSQASGHSYPSSNGLSGNTGAGGSHISQHGASYPSQQGAGYPQQQGVGYPSQHGAAPPPYPGMKSGDVNRPYSGSYPNQHPQGPPPPYTNVGPSGYGNYGHGGASPQMPGYFGNYANNGNFGGVSRSSGILRGVGMAGAGAATVLTGLALWNLARSTGHHHHTVIYDNRGQPVAVAPSSNAESSVDSILGDLENCSLTISNDNATEVLAIPCAIATSFSPGADIKEKSVISSNDTTKCTITVVTKAGKEFLTTIPCSMLLKTAAENNVTEATLLNEGTVAPKNEESPGDSSKPAAPLLTGEPNTAINTSLNCKNESGDIRDPINPCFALTYNVTVLPLHYSNVTDNTSTPGSA